MEQVPTVHEIDNPADVMAEEILESSEQHWLFPYGDLSKALLAYDQRWPALAEEALVTGRVGDGAYQCLKDAYDEVPVHFQKVIDTIVGGTFINDMGIVPFATARCGDCIAIDITIFFDNLTHLKYEVEDFFDDPELLRGEEGGEQEVSAYPTTYLVATPNELSLVFAPSRSIHEGLCHNVITREWLFKYVFLTTMVSLMHCGFAIYGIVNPAPRPRKTTEIKVQQVMMPNDAVTNSLFSRDDNAIEAYSYSVPNVRGQAIAVKTGRGIGADVVVVRTGLTIVPGNTSVDAAIDSYRLTPEDRFWLEAVCSIARAGHRDIRGSDLLKFRGYKNPYQPSARDVMHRAFHCLQKMSCTRITIDTARERKKYEDIRERYDLRPIIDCNWSVMRFDDDTLDFEIQLNMTGSDSPLGAIPLAIYARDKKELLVADRKDLEFKKVRLTYKHRLMWSYMVHRIRSKSVNKTIVFDTLFRNITDEDIDRFERRRLLDVLRRMLDERQAEGRLRFQWNLKNGADYSVTITEDNMNVPVIDTAKA